MSAYSGSPDAVDYSFSRANAAQLHAAGIKLAARYLSHTPGKNLSKAEAADLHAHHIDILLNWESSSGRPAGGAANGTPDGRDAGAQARALGAPSGSGIAYSADWDVRPSEYAAVAAYLRAAKAAHGHFKLGIYGHAGLVDYLAARGVCDFYWQCYAWSGGRLSSHADLYQFKNGQTLAGASVDFDKILHSDALGAWRWNPANQIQEGPLMALTDAQQATLLSQVDALHDRLAKIDNLAYAVGNSLVPAVADMRPKVQTMYAVVSDNVSGLAVRIAAVQTALENLSTSGGAPSDLATVRQAVKELLDGATIKAAA